MPTLSCPWQMCAMDIFTLERVDYLICGDFYSKMILVKCLPSGQSNTIKVISLLKEMFSEHGIPEVLCSDNSLPYVSVQFTEFCTSWGITHETSSPHYLQLNRFAEACMKSVKHALQHAKYSGANPQLTLLVLWATPINAKLPLPAELLYQCQIRTTIPGQCILINSIACWILYILVIPNKDNLCLLKLCRSLFLSLNAWTHLVSVICQCKVIQIWTIWQ